MNTVSIDALRQRKVEINKELVGIRDEQQALLDKAATENGRDFTTDEAAQFTKNTERKNNKLAMLDRYDLQLTEVAAMLEREKNMGAIANDNARPGQPVSKDGFSSLGEQMIAVARAATTGRVDKRLMLGSFDATGNFRAAGGSDGALNEAVPSEGGFLVGSDVSDKIYQRSYLTGEMQRRCTKQTISANSNRLKLRVVDEDSRADGSRMGGVLAFWQNEADTLKLSMPKFRGMELVLNKLTALLYATDDLLEDAPALEAWIMNNLPGELTFRVEDALINGLGAGQPLGILNSQATLSIARDAGDSGATISAADILNMWARFWQPGLQNHIAEIATENLTVGAAGPTAAAWFIDQSIIPKLFSLTLGTGTAVILLYHPPGYNGLQGPYGQLLGLPVIPTEHNQVLGTPGDIILADLSQYLLADKGSIQSAASMHVRFLQDEMAFRFIKRVDAQTTWKKPLTPKNGGPTLAPFVTVAVRS